MRKGLLLCSTLLVCMLCLAKQHSEKQKQEKNTLEIVDSLENERYERLAAELEEMRKWHKIDSLQSTLHDYMYRIPIEESLTDKYQSCVSESNDTPEHYGGFGIGTGQTVQEARQKALEAAVEYIKQRCQSSIQVVDSVTTIEWAVRDSIDFSNIQIVCQKLYVNRYGMVECGVAVHIPKVSNNGLSNDEIELSKEELDSMKLILKAKVLEEYNNGVSRNAKNE